MGNVTPGDMRAIIQSQENGAPGGGLACIDLLNRMWDCRTKRRISAKQVLSPLLWPFPPANFGPAPSL